MWLYDKKENTAIERNTVGLGVRLRYSDLVRRVVNLTGRGLLSCAHPSLSSPTNHKLNTFLEW